MILTLASLLFVMEVVERKEDERNYLDGGGRNLEAFGGLTAGRRVM